MLPETSSRISLPVSVLYIGMPKDELGISIDFKSFSNKRCASTRYGLWKGAVIGRNLFTKRIFRSECGTRAWSRPVGALTFRRAKFKPYRDIIGPVTTTFRALLTREIAMCLSGAKCLFVASMCACTDERGRSRMESIGGGPLSPFL